MHTKKKKKKSIKTLISILLQMCTHIDFGFWDCPDLCSTMTEKYEVYDVVDRKEKKGRKVYRVKWVGYKHPRYDTWEDGEQLVADGLLQAVSEVNRFYIEKSKGRDVQTLKRFRERIGSSTHFGNDGEGRCAIRGIIYVAKLLNMEEYIEGVNVEGFENLTYVQIREFVIKQNQKMEGKNLPQLMIGGNGKKKWKSNNFIKSSKKKYLELDLEVGVYLCGASGRNLLRHVFVLYSWTPGIFWVYDSAEKEEVMYSASYCSWIERWHFIQKCYTV